MSRLDPAEVQAQVARALAEDWGGTDLTGEVALRPGRRCRARFESRQVGVLCGSELAREVFRQVDPEVSWEPLLEDGAGLEPGSALATVEGRAAAILVAERTALNFLQHLTGIASLTRRYVELAAPFGVVILDTRKTLPGLRRLEKYATLTGGAQNHRMGLFDAVLVKDNHVDLAGGLAAALEWAGERCPAQRIEVEVRSLEELRVALRFGVGRVLLDNLSPSQVAEAVELVSGRARVEVSGGVRLENLVDYAAARPDFISVGRITQSAPALDLAMKVVADPA